MNLSLRAKLRLPTDSSDAELQAACSRYYAIYNGVLESAADESVKELARNKLQALIDDAKAENVTLVELGDCIFSSTAANINAEVEAELARYSGSLNKDQAAKLNRMIERLPESPKRYYLSALVLLFSGEKTEEVLKEAASKLRAAAMNDPENPIYRDMIEQLGTEIQSYQNDLAEYQKKLDDARRKAAFWQGVKTFFGGLGTVLFWGVGALLTVGGALLSCFCSMCDAC